MNNDFDPLKDSKLGFIARNNLKFNRFLQRKGWVKDNRYRSYPLIFTMITFSVGYVYVMYFNYKFISNARQGKKTVKVSKDIVNHFLDTRTLTVQRLHQVGNISL